MFIYLFIFFLSISIKCLRIYSFRNLKQPHTPKSLLGEIVKPNEYKDTCW